MEFSEFSFRDGSRILAQHLIWCFFDNSLRSLTIANKSPALLDAAGMLDTHHISKYVWKRKNLLSHKSTGISYIQYKCLLWIKWSMSLWNLSENDYFEQVSENFRNGKIFCRQKLVSLVMIFIGINDSSLDEKFVTLPSRLLPIGYVIFIIYFKCIFYYCQL